MGMNCCQVTTLALIKQNSIFYSTIINKNNSVFRETRFCNSYQVGLYLHFEDTDISIKDISEIVVKWTNLIALERPLRSYN